MLKNQTQIKVILFDLGNVLVDLGDKASLNDMLGMAGEEADIWQHWLASPVVKAFDSGQISFDSFAENRVNTIPSLGTLSEFKERFTQWPIGLYEGAVQLVSSVKPQFHRAILSNTNAAHWPRLMDEMQLSGLFHSYFASHHLGEVKPEKAIYQKVLDQLHVEASNVLFIDDNQVNIDQALAMGIHAFRVKGIEQASKVLRDHGLLL
jgi:glucose-1-phosphatase